MSWNRRRFLDTTLRSSTLVALGGPTIPGFLSRSAQAARTTKPNERILVVVQLLGGNDGLNTVVPHGLDGYNRGRRALRISSAQIHKITPEIGLHPSLGGMAKLLEKGRLSVIQGVGYPNPDRSHFRSMEIWETAKLENDAKALETGWLGRALDSSARKPGEDPPGLHIGGRLAADGASVSHDRSPFVGQFGKLSTSSGRHGPRKADDARRPQSTRGGRSPRRRPVVRLHSP